MPRFREPYSLIRRTLRSGRQVYYYRFWRPDGRRSGLFSTGCTNKAAARRVCEQLLRDGRLGNKSPLFLEHFADFWAADGAYVTYQRETSRLSEEHRRNSDHIAEHDIMPTFGPMRLDAIGPSDVRAWLLSFENPKVANRALRTLRTMLNRAVANREIPNSPAAGVRMRKVEKIQRGILTRAEAARLLDPDTWPQYFTNKKHYALSITAAATGMRLSEIMRLRPDDVHDDYLEVRNTKGGYDRIAPCLKEIADLLRAVAPITLNRKTVAQYFKKALKAAKIPDYDARRVTFHSWRHFFNTQMQAAGVTDGVLRAVIGHRSEAMTVNYTKFMSEHYRELSEAQRFAILGGGSEDDDDQEGTA